MKYLYLYFQVSQLFISLYWLLCAPLHQLTSQALLLPTSPYQSEPSSYYTPPCFQEFLSFNFIWTATQSRYSTCKAAFDCSSSSALVDAESLYSAFKHSGLKFRQGERIWLPPVALRNLRLLLRSGNALSLVFHQPMELFMSLDTLNHSSSCNNFNFLEMWYCPLYLIK